jgi:hypothetical protein
MCKRTINGKGPEEERETKKTKEKDKRVERKSEKTSDKGSRKKIERRGHLPAPNRNLTRLPPAPCCARN